MIFQRERVRLKGGFSFHGDQGKSRSLPNFVTKCPRRFYCFQIQFDLSTCRRGKNLVICYINIIKFVHICINWRSGQSSLHQHRKLAAYDTTYISTPPYIKKSYLAIFLCYYCTYLMYYYLGIYLVHNNVIVNLVFSVLLEAQE